MSTPSYPEGMNAVDASIQDARFVRTREQLRKAVLQLAISRSISTISVADLTRQAGVNRATFYNHADSPSQLLEAALLEDLDSIRAEFLESTSAENMTFEQIWRQAVNETVEHVSRFEQVYLRGFSDYSDGTLQNLLSKHIAKSMIQLFEQNPLLLPESQPESKDFLKDAYASAIAAALTAILGVWIRTPERDLEAYVAAVLNVLPAWMHDSKTKDLSKEGHSESLDNR